MTGTDATFETREGSLQLRKTRGYFVEQRQGENVDLPGALSRVVFPSLSFRLDPRSPVPPPPSALMVS